MTNDINECSARYDFSSTSAKEKKKRKERKDAICICIFSSSSSISNTTLTYISIMYCHIVVFILILCSIYISVELLMKEITVLRLLRRYPGVVCSFIHFVYFFFPSIFDTYHRFQYVRI